MTDRLIRSLELINRLGALNAPVQLTIRTSGLSMTIGRDGTVQTRAADSVVSDFMAPSGWEARSRCRERSR